MKTVRLFGVQSITEDPIADYYMNDYYLRVVPYALTNDQNEEVDRGT